MSSSIRHLTSSVRSPLIWILFPWIGGILLAPFLREIPLFLIFAVALFFVLFSWLLLEIQFRFWKPAWMICFVCAGLSISAVVQIVRFPIPKSYAQWDRLPPREIILQLEVIKVRYSPKIDQDGMVNFLGKATGAVDSLIPFDTLGEIYCYLHKASEMPRLQRGDQLQARGVAYNRMSTTHPRIEYRNGTILKLEPAKSEPVSQLRELILDHITNTLVLGAPVDSRLPSYVQSIITGDKRFLSSHDKRRFQQAGVMHFLAISGFHLSVVALLVFTVLQIVRIPQKWVALSTVCICGAYVWMTGSPVSAQRALIMLSLFFLARWVKRKPALLAATAASAWIVLLIDPGELSSPGYQLSFLIVTALITHAGPMQRTRVFASRKDPFLPVDTEANKRSWTASLKAYFLGSLSVSWTAFWISLPIVCLYFGTLPFAAILLNPLLAPLFALVLVAGLLSVSFGFIHLYFVSEFLNHALWVLLSLIKGMIDTASREHWLLVKANGDKWIAYLSVVFLLFILLGFDASKNRNRWVFIAVPAVSLISVLLQNFVSNAY